MSTTDASASTTRKYATASTRAGTLSRVITSCGGIVCVIVRSVTRTIRSATGTSSTRPGPFWATSRPKRKTTPRSYSRSTRTDAPARDTASTTKTTRTTRTAVISLHLPFLGRSDSEREAVDRLDDHGAALGHGQAFRFEFPQTGAPERAVELHLTDRARHRAHGRHTPHERPRPAANRQPARSERLREQQPGEREARERNRDTGHRHGAAGSAGAREGEHDPGGQRGGRAGAERAVRRHMCLGDHERGADDHEDDAERSHGPIITALRPR